MKRSPGHHIHGHGRGGSGEEQVGGGGDGSGNVVMVMVMGIETRALTGSIKHSTYLSSDHGE